MNFFLRALAVAALMPFVSPAAQVSILETENSFALTNAVIAARVSKQSGDLISLRYKGQEMLDTPASRPAAYWSHDVARGQTSARVTIDPASNGGERGEVSLKGISNGRPMGSGPGGSVIADIEIRYTLGRDDSGLFTYAIFSHPTNYPATSVGEARFCAKLNDRLFDWMTVDANRNMRMITTYDWNHGTVMNFKEARRMNTGVYKGMVEHKYDYSANQFDVRAWGWSSSEKRIGIWFINPSVEYLSGGPATVELTAHRDATFNPRALEASAPPCLLNYWRGSHYGGSSCSIAATDAWTKVIGPFLIYCNSEQSLRRGKGVAPVLPRDALWRDALAEAVRQEKAWPYEWVSGTDYPHKNERMAVAGQIVLNDPQMPKVRFDQLLVGLSAPDYVPAQINRDSGEGGFDPVGLASRVVEWQSDAKHYQFWVRADARGNFSIPNVRPGNYTLHAIADGVLGEFALTNVTVQPGKTPALGKLNWQPVRYGRQLWEIGIPNRKASEFFKGDDYSHWGWYLEYPKLFPNDVRFVVGKSDYRRDWFFEQVPHAENTNNVTGAGFGRSTTWSIAFTLPNAPRGKATLRLAICGVGTRSLTATMNDKLIGSVTGLVYNATINRDGIGGSWIERNLSFDASLMKAGGNVLKLTIPAGSLTSGVMYDYLRLELDEAVNVADR